ncbi:MAG: phage major capsid protein, P2 family [Candidatus Sedimenticola sp. (ex Thyasira tokunagai)]
MRKNTRVAFNAYKQQLATLNGVDDVTEKFAVDPTIEQKLEDRMQENSEFLGKINIVGVPEQSGEKLGLGTGSSIAGTTDTNVQDRETTDPTDLDQKGYHCHQTNFDTHVRYAKLDMWAKFPDFQQRMRDAILRQIGRDRMMIGFNGTSRAATSNRAANPLLQDVNVGWLQEARVNNAARVLDEVVNASGVVRVGADGDYALLDSLVFDVTGSLLEPWYAEDTELVVIMGRELLADKYFPLIESHGGTPTESRALDMMISAKRVGGLQAARVPFFPSRAMAITRLDNLSVYWQEGTRRRTIEDNAKRDRVEDYNSVNEDYVIEDMGGFAMVENIVLPDGQGGWA